MADNDTWLMIDLLKSEQYRASIENRRDTRLHYILDKTYILRTLTHFGIGWMVHP